MQNRFDTITIIAEDGLTRASFVPERGGIGHSITLPWRGKAREILYTHDCFWDETIDDLPGGLPYLFPICGRLDGAYEWQGKSFDLPIHGVSWWQTWQAKKINAHTVELCLRDNETTQQHYPFAFCVTLRFEVQTGKLICTQTVENRGHEAMPYYAGFHPYFLLPGVADSKANTTLHLAASKQYQYNESLTAVIGDKPCATFPAMLDDAALNEQLFALAQGDITLSYPDGFKLCMRVSDHFNHCQLYNMPEKPFYCVEPWMGQPGGLNQAAMQATQTAQEPNNQLRWLTAGKQDTATLILSAI